MCNREYHQALRDNGFAWWALKYVGKQLLDATDTEPLMAIELRNCECGSTLAIEVAP